MEQTATDINDEQAETMAVIIDTLADVQRQGYGVCKNCNMKVYGEDLSEILQGLGEHGESGLCQ
jgi:hypothetical protein